MIEEPFHVVVIGGGFAGLAVSRLLGLGALPEAGGRAPLRVTIVEPKTFAEYTPGVLRALAWPGVAASLQAALPVSGVICGALEALQCGTEAPVTRIGSDGAVIEVSKSSLGGDLADDAPAALVREWPSGALRRVPFDAIVLAVGTDYACASVDGWPVKAVTSTGGSRHAAGRTAELDSARAVLASAPSLAIVGGGPVGVELAAEAAIAWPRKAVTLVHAGASLLPGFPAPASTAATAWLRAHGVRVLLNQRLKPTVPATPEAPEPVALRTDAGTEVAAAAVVRCTGGSANTAWATHADSSSAVRAVVLPDGRLRVDECLRLRPGEAAHDWLPCAALALGDVARHAAGEPALAHTAEKQAEVVAASLRAVAAACMGIPARGRWRAAAAAAATLAHSYPGKLTGRDTSPLISIVSLGPYEAVAVFDDFVLGSSGCGLRGGGGDCGARRLASLAKHIVEFTKVSVMRGSAAAMTFWVLADWAAVLLHVWVTGPLSFSLRARRADRKRH